MRPSPRLRRLLWLLLLAGGGLALVSALGYRLGARVALETASAQAAQQLHLHAQALNQRIERYRALPQLLAKKRNLIVIMASTLTRRNAEISFKAMSLGAADYIPKPESTREISAAEAGTFTAAQVIDMTLLIRFYERMGDHAVSLVRRVGFLVTGDAMDTLSEGVDVQEF